MDPSQRSYLPCDLFALTFTLCVPEMPDHTAKLLRSWLHWNALNVSTESTWATLGGNVTAHVRAVELALQLSADAVAAHVPAITVLDGTSEDLGLAAGQYIRQLDGGYGAVVIHRADEASVASLQALAIYFFGQLRCAHPVFLQTPVACGRIAWFLSTRFGEDELDASDSIVAEKAQAHWSGRILGPLRRKAATSDRCVFVRGEPPPSQFEAIYERFQQKEKKTTSEGGLEAWISERFVGQQGAVKGVAAKLEALRSWQRTQPTVFYFYGTAGTGKTRFAELIAEALERPRIRLEMESYSAEIDVNRLFGAPAAYDPGGLCLVDELLAKPNAVVIFDEIEKAHPSIFREKLHSALSAGVMTHKRDLTKVANLSNVVFVFTSNCFEDVVRELAATSTEEDDLYSKVRDQAALLINDNPRAPCSSTRGNPFDDASLRSRIPRSKQYPFLPLDRSDLERLLDMELRRLGTFAFASDVVREYAKLGNGDARAAIDALRDDVELAFTQSRPNKGRAVLTLATPSTPFEQQPSSRLVVTWLDDTKHKPRRTTPPQSQSQPQPPREEQPPPQRRDVVAVPPRPLVKPQGARPELEVEPTRQPVAKVVTSLLAIVATLVAAYILVASLGPLLTPMIAVPAAVAAAAYLGLSVVFSPATVLRAAIAAARIAWPVVRSSAVVLGLAISEPHKALNIGLLVVIAWLLRRRPSTSSRGTMTVRSLRDDSTPPTPSDEPVTSPSTASSCDDDDNGSSSRPLLTPAVTRTPSVVSADDSLSCSSSVPRD